MLKDCLISIRKISYPKKKYEVIVVDNGSTDGSVELLRSKFKWSKIVELDKNYGFAIPNNYGAKIAKGKYLVFLNNDTLVDKNWLIELVKPLEKDKSIGAGTSKILYWSRPRVINAMGGFWTLFGFPGLIGDGERDDKFQDTRTVFFPSGCSMIIRSELFKKLGGFDSDYFLYCEDVDLGWRIWNDGKKVIVIPTSVVYHKKSVTARSLNINAYYYSTRNSLATILKNARRRDIWWMVPFFLLSHFLALLWLIFQGKVMEGKGILKGIKDCFKMLEKINQKRKMVNKSGLANLKMGKLAENILLLIKVIRRYSSF